MTDPTKALAWTVGKVHDVRWCHCCQDITVNRLRCPACLDGELKAKGGRK